MKAKNKFVSFLPLLLTIPFILVSILILYACLSSDGSSICFRWLGYGGKFRYPDIKFLGLSMQNTLMILGMIVCCGVSVFRRKQYGFSAAQAAIATFVFFLFAYLGAKLLAAVEYCISNGWKEWNMEGQSLFGVMYIALPAVPIIAYLFKKNKTDMFDFFAPTCPMLLAFIRTGCFLGGCCGAKLITLGGSPTYLPVQLFEVICDLLILFLLLRREDTRSRRGHRGSIWPLMMMTYCFTRFWLEFIRDNKLFFGIFSLSQLHCLLFFTLGTAWFCKLWDKAAHQKDHKVQHKKH